MLEIVTDRKIRIAVIGCGQISESHFDAIRRHANDLELIAVCDTDQLVLRAHEDIHRVSGYRKLNDLLVSENPDLIALCTPSGIHSEQSILAAHHGVNVMTEKPMATRWRDGIAMVEACDDAGVYLFVVKQNRCNPTLRLLKRAIDDKRFGKINMVRIDVFWTRPQSYYDQAKWRGTRELDGGAFMNQASHYVDLLDWLIGPVAKVQAMVETTRDIEVEDSGVLNVQWYSGALGSMAVTMLTYPRNLEGSVTILGEQGSARVGGVAVNEIQLWDFSEARDYDEQIEVANYKTTHGSGHLLYYKNVVDVLRGEAEPETDGREGLKSLEVLTAAYLSAHNGRTVSLPFAY